MVRGYTLQENENLRADLSSATSKLLYQVPQLLFTVSTAVSLSFYSWFVLCMKYRRRKNHCTLRTLVWTR